MLIVDDDPLLRSSLDSLFRSVGLETRLFASAQDVMDAQFSDATCCIVMDIRMPIIFITGHGDIPMSVKAMKAGAFDFMTKPFRDQEMLDTVEAALTRDGERRSQDRVLADGRARYDSLTPREKEVMAGVTRGLLNKQVAAELGISEITVKLHRSSLMKKLGVRALADLVRLAEALGINRG
ncbi:MAG: response regulator transcription factor [Alphaproteobacteria bacterium]